MWAHNIKMDLREIGWDGIITCYLRSQPIQRFVAGQQLRRYATVLETLLGSRPRVTMEVQLEEVFSMWSVPRSYLEDTWGELSVLSAVASKQATRKGAPVQPVEKNDRTSDCGDCNCNCKGVGQ
jgi:hypothetical protein